MDVCRASQGSQLYRVRIMFEPHKQSPIHGFLDNPSMMDYPGRLAAVMFLGGCNFQCRYCHNASLIAPKTLGMTWGEANAILRKFSDNWVNAAAITGGEPCIRPELPELMRTLKNSFGWNVKLDTNGSRPAMLEQCLPLVDYVAMDVKASPEMYPGLTGWSDTAALSESIRLLMSWGGRYEFRTTVVEGFHSDDQMHAIGRWINGADMLALQPFTPREDLPDPALAASPRTAPGRMEEIGRIMRPYVRELVIRGN